MRGANVAPGISILVVVAIVVIIVVSIACANICPVHTEAPLSQLSSSARTYTQKIKICMATHNLRDACTTLPYHGSLGTFNHTRTACRKSEFLLDKGFVVGVQGHELTVHVLLFAHGPKVDRKMFGKRTFGVRIDATVNADTLLLFRVHNEQKCVVLGLTCEFEVAF